MTVGDLFDVDVEPVAWREATGPGGDRATIVCLHGLGASRTSFDSVLAPLGAAGYRAVAWDMPGYGASPAVTGPATFEAMADAVIALLDALAVDTACLVGHSLGGMVALHTALRHRERVDKLVLVSTSPAFGLDGSTDPDEWRALRLDALARGETPASMADTVLRSVAGTNTSDEAIADAAASMARVSPDGLRAAVELLPTHDLRARLGEIMTPTLVIVGGADHETPPSYSRHLAHHLSGARGIVEISGAGHLVPNERPEALVTAIARFADPKRTEP